MEENKKIDYSSISLGDISKDWINKQRLTIEGRLRVKEKLRKESSFQSEKMELIEKFGTLVAKYLYTIPKYEEYSHIFSGYLYNGGNRSDSLKVVIKSMHFGFPFPHAPDGYISKSTGVSIDGSVVVPMSELNSPGFCVGGTYFSFYLTSYIPNSMSIPSDWYIKAGLGEFNFKTEFIDLISPDQFDTLREIYLEIISGEWKECNALNKYIDSCGFLGSISTFRRLEEVYPELAPIYFEMNKTALMERYRGTPEGKELMIKKGLLEGDLEARIFKIRSSLDYLP